MGLSCEFQMFGQTWKCVRKPCRREAECDMEKRTIFIDDKFDEEDFLDYLHHELAEVATFYTGCSFTKEYPDDADTVFLMNHTQLDTISSAVRGAYEAIKKSMLPLSPRESKRARHAPSPVQKIQAKSCDPIPASTGLEVKAAEQKP